LRSSSHSLRSRSLSRATGKPADLNVQR